MAIFRVERTRDYTVMSNYHLRDKRLSLKAKGLLSQMLSLPEDWDYTLTGLAQINKESKDAIRSAVNELEEAGYIRRRQKTDPGGKFAGNEYIIYESPREAVGQDMDPGETMAREKASLEKPPLEKPPLEKPSSEKPSSENPTTENPITENPAAEKPSPENPTQLKKDKPIKEESNTEEKKDPSFLSGEVAGDSRESGYHRRKADKQGREAGMESLYREVVRENVGYDSLVHDHPFDVDMIDEIVELITEIACMGREVTRVAGNDFPHEMVKSRLLKLDGEHIRFVLDCLKENTTKIRNIKQYLLTVLFNAPTTIGNYYAAKVNYDMQGG